MECVIVNVFVQIIEETLRLHPTVSVIAKITGEDVITNDYRIPKNTRVMVCY